MREFKKPIFAAMPPQRGRRRFDHHSTLEIAA
jgi:hypothetical protein